MNKFLLIFIALIASLSINATPRDTIKYANATDSIRLVTNLTGGKWFYGEADIALNTSSGAFYLNSDTTYLKIDTAKFSVHPSADRYLYYKTPSNGDTLGFVHVLNGLVTAPTFTVNGKSTLNLYEGSLVNIALDLKNPTLDITQVGIAYSGSTDTVWYTLNNFPLQFYAKDTVKFKIGVKNSIPTSKWSAQRTVNVTKKLQITSSTITWTTGGITHTYPGSTELVDSTIIGENVYLTVETKDGNTSQVKYTWVKNDNTIFTAFGNKLSLTNFNANDYGKYVVTITDDSLTLKQTFVVSKPVVPVIPPVIPEPEPEIALKYISNEAIGYGNGELIKKITYDGNLIFDQAFKTGRVDFIIHAVSTFNPVYIWVKDEVVLGIDSILSIPADSASFGKYTVYVTDNNYRVITAEFTLSGLITANQIIESDTYITNAYIYTITGQLIKANVNGTFYQISNDIDIKPGIYILKTGNKTVKFVRKN